MAAVLGLSIPARQQALLRRLLPLASSQGFAGWCLSLNFSAVVK
jgi:hypothetical protein